MASMPRTKEQPDLLSEKKYRVRKIARALSTRHALHVVLKAREPILRKHHAAIKSIIEDTQVRFSDEGLGLKIKALAIQADHIHLVLKTPSRKAFADSLRYLAGTIALLIAKGKLWRQRVWSRVVKTGRDLDGVLAYVCRNPIKAGVFSLEDHVLIVDGILRSSIDPHTILKNRAPPHSTIQMGLF